MGKQGMTLSDIEKAMGQRANDVSDRQFDPETGSWTRTISFDLTNPLPLPEAQAPRRSRRKYKRPTP